MLLTYEFTIRDNSISPLGTRVPSLTPTFTLFKKLSDNTNVTPQPVITEIGLGKYKFSYDPEVNGEVTWQIDAGSSLASHGDRYKDGQCTLEPSRVQTSTTSAGALVGSYATNQDPGTLIAAKALSSTQTTGTMGEALLIMRALAAGKKVKDPTLNTMTVYAPDNTTPIMIITYAPNIGDPISTTSNR